VTSGSYWAVVIVAGMTANRDKIWRTQQARNLALFCAEQPMPPRYLIRDNDGKFVEEFDRLLKDEGVEIIRIPPHSPNMNPFAERFVGSIRSEALDHFIVFGEDHLRHIVSDYIRFYNTSRPHQGVGNVPLSGAVPPAVSPVAARDILCESSLGGLLKSYRRAS
jgi:putative transposase